MRQKSLRPEEGNLLLTNDTLKKKGLKSLLSIKEEFDGKLGRKNKKSTKKKRKVDQSKKSSEWSDLEQRAHFYKQKLILEELKKLTSLVEKLEKKIKRIERNL